MNNALVLPNWLTMLTPQAIPSEQFFLKPTEEELEKGLADPSLTSLGTETRLAERTEVAEQIRQSLASLPSQESVALFEESQQDDALHDHYFRIQRVAGEAPDIFARMVLSARLILLEEIEESKVTVSSLVLDAVDRGLADLYFHVCGGVKGAAIPCVTVWQASGTVFRPMVRWIRGHQIFAALSQGLIFSLHSMAEAIRKGYSERIRQWADLSIALLRASSAAFVLTGDFAAEEYESLVRPSMMPPASAINLSGLMSVDHRFLVQVMRDMRPALRALHEQEPARHASLQREMAAVYDNHIHVCERFVGEQPSLLTARHAKKSGPALIEQFKMLRMKAFEVPPRAPRLEPQSKQAAPNALSCPVSHSHDLTESLS